ncbi:unnamed protein product [Microthlaspi erraticum]|uniref:F-box domain-containing protein n=1 Tax=Microthlaspi erraticum TaxID=1685480 RepID=A0A6D2II76_9BRAS|nr:unnamed protein product [Microthlaspi erraticum]
MKISDLPHDLEWEILARVPAKSLAKSETICKRWYTLFRDESFVRKNKKLGKSVRESMILRKYGVYSTGDDLHGIHNSTGDDRSILFSGKLSYLKKDLEEKDVEISQIFHCDGLILCSTQRNTRLVIWNPCTGQTREIKPRTRYRIEDTYALGYANNSKRPHSSSSSSPHSHKILRCFYHGNEQSVKVAFEMYDLSSGSWRVLDNLTRYDCIFRHGVSLKGNTYWVYGYKGTGLFVMKFDFTTEKFVRLSLPSHSFPHELSAPISVVRDEKLSVLHLDIQQSSCVVKIWVTNKVDDEDKDLSWRSVSVLEVDYRKFGLQSLVNVSSFLLDEENKVAVCCDMDYEDEYRNCITRICIVGEDMYKQVYKEIGKGSSFNWPLLLTYVPSLVRI